MKDKTVIYLLLIALAAGLPLMYYIGNITAVSQQYATLDLNGSTTVFPIAQACGEALEALYPWLDVTVNPTGSGTGISTIAQNLTDIGMASRALKTSEKTAYPYLVEHTIAYDGIAIVTNNNLLGKITNLTLSQVQGIYNNSITNWNQINASLPSTPIVTAGRATTSGTYDYFIEYIMDNNATSYSADATFEANAGVQNYVQTTPNSVGYVGLGYLTGTHVLLIDDGADLWYPSVPAVANGSYPISRPLFLITSPDTYYPGSLAELFLNFVLGPQGQTIVASIDYVPLP
ncbi:MAG: phosphate ABC transporter substrate-binding protein [Promethearchaeota archaeon]|nr:MAG: phosphate ABC transporter substrate-binding protein [Candidatus Lokiarchaeota archaeon]